MKKSATSNITLFLLTFAIVITFSSFTIRSDANACFNNQQESSDQEQESIQDEVIIEVPEPEALYELEFKEDDSVDLLELKTLIDECEKNKETAHNMAECARNLGYEESSDILKEAKYCWLRNETLRQIYEERYEYIKFQFTLLEFPNASYIWKYLHDCGLNDYVSAGILGNMMCECSNQTLNLNPEAVSPYGFYGLCQWSKSYTNVWYTDLEFQCEFLMSTIQYELDTFGYAYKKNFNYTSFTELTNEKDAALAFAKCYERCDKSSYNVRQKCATVAYDYFMEYGMFTD